MQSVIDKGGLGFFIPLQLIANLIVPLVRCIKWENMDEDKQDLVCFLAASTVN